MAQLTCTISTDLRWARLFIWIASVPIYFGWRYSDRAEERIVAIGAKLVRTRVVPVAHGAEVYDPRHTG